MVRLMCVLRVYIKPFIFENIFSEIKKTVNIFSISKKIFSKIINYCVSLGHILIKSIYIYIYIYIYNFLILFFTNLYTIEEFIGFSKITT